VRAETNESVAVRQELDHQLAPDEVEFIPDERVEILNGKAGADEKRERAPGAGAVDVMAIITKALTSAGLMKPPA